MPSRYTDILKYRYTRWTKYISETIYSRKHPLEDYVGTPNQHKKSEFTLRSNVLIKHWMTSILL